MSFDLSIIVVYISAVVLIVSSLVFGGIITGLLVFGVLYLILGLISQTKFSLFKLIEIRLSALIWVALAIFTSFSSYLFGFTANKTVFWISIATGLISLFTILVSKIKIEESK